MSPLAAKIITKMTQLVGWAECNDAQQTRVYMRYIKQIAIMMLMICWAAQGLAQPTRDASSAKERRSTTIPFGSMGICQAIPQGKLDGSATYDYYPYGVSPKADASLYWTLKYPKFAAEGGVSLSPSDVEKAMHGVKLETYDSYDYDNATWTVIQQPKHGVLQKRLSASSELSYVPGPNFNGNDKAIFMVDVQGYKIKVVYYFKVVDFAQFDNITDLANKTYCSNHRVWKTSSLPLSFIDNNFNLQNITFRDFSGAAVGETVDVG